MIHIPRSIDAVETLLASQGYVASRALATVVFLSLKLGRPLFLEGEAGTGKTEIAKTLATALGRRLIRLQCYDGLEQREALYEWNYAAQLLHMRAAEGQGGADMAQVEREVYQDRYLIRRPLLQALQAPVSRYAATVPSQQINLHGRDGVVHAFFLQRGTRKRRIRNRFRFVDD